jgi:hypothetical protein
LQGATYLTAVPSRGGFAAFIRPKLQTKWQMIVCLPSSTGSDFQLVLMRRRDCVQQNKNKNKKAANGTLGFIGFKSNHAYCRLFTSVGVTTSRHDAIQ